METTYQNVIAEIVEAIFATMLNLQPIRCEGASAPGDDALLASVHIAGQWTGSVVLALAPPVASAAAAAMFEMSEDQLTTADRHEAASELVNMIGGNLKSLLPGPSYLSLPTIVVGHELDLHVHHAELVDNVTLACQAGEVQIRLYAKTDQRHAAQSVEPT